MIHSAPVLLKKTKKLLCKIKQYCEFYPSEIEIDIYRKPYMDGSDFEKEINNLLKEINEYENFII